MDTYYIATWAALGDVMKKLRGRLITYDICESSVDIRDRSSGSLIITLKDFTKIINEPDSVKIYSRMGSVIFRKIIIHSRVEEFRFTLTNKKTKTITIGNTEKIVTTFTFTHNDITTKEFVKWLSNHDYISDNIKAEPGSITIGRSKEDPHKWTLEEEVIQ